jgi:hypothetical protein
MKPYKNCSHGNDRKRDRFAALADWRSEIRRAAQPTGHYVIGRHRRRQEDNYFWGEQNMGRQRHHLRRRADERCATRRRCAVIAIAAHAIVHRHARRHAGAPMAGLGGQSSARSPGANGQRGEDNDQWSRPTKHVRCTQVRRSTYFAAGPNSSTHDYFGLESSRVLSRDWNVFERPSLCFSQLLI